MAQTKEIESELGLWIILYKIYVFGSFCFQKKKEMLIKYNFLWKTNIFVRSDNTSQSDPFRFRAHKTRTLRAGPLRHAQFMRAAIIGLSHTSLSPWVDLFFYFLLVFMIKLSMFKNWNFKKFTKLSKNFWKLDDKTFLSYSYSYYDIHNVFFKF